MKKPSVGGLFRERALAALLGGLLLCHLLRRLLRLLLGCHGRMKLLFVSANFRPAPRARVHDMRLRCNYCTTCCAPHRSKHKRVDNFVRMKNDSYERLFICYSCAATHKTNTPHRSTDEVCSRASEHRSIRCFFALPYYARNERGTAPRGAVRRTGASSKSKVIDVSAAALHTAPHPATGRETALSVARRTSPAMATY